MAYQSNLAAVQAQMHRARDAGLIAAAQVVVNAVKEGLAGGYTSGDFVTGASVNAVTRTDPMDENGVRIIRVGTNLLYNLFWEIGHLNIFLRRFVRKEVWVPRLLSTAEEQALAFSRTFVRFMDQGPLRAT